MIQIVCDLLNVFEKWKGQCLLYLLKIKLVDIRFIWFKVHCIYGSNVKWANLINAVQKESFMVIGATIVWNFKCDGKRKQYWPYQWLLMLQMVPPRNAPSSGINWPLIQVSMTSTFSYRLLYFDKLGMSTRIWAHFKA